MRVATAAVLGVTLLACVSLGSAQAQQATPGPDVPPAGEFSVTPVSGPIGTLVTLTGHLDQPITWIQFRCAWRVEAFSSLYPSQPTSDFSIEFEIPAVLSVRQPRPGEGVTIEPRPEAECSFRAISWHQLLFASVPFTVTERAGALPSTGLTYRSNGTAGTPLAVVILAAAGIVLVLVGWRYNQRVGVGPA